MKDARGHGSNSRGGEAAHQSGVRAALSKDRFTDAIPPGSTRDFFVKQAAQWAAAGMAHGAVLAAGGGALGVAGQMIASYTKWGGDLARKFGPKLKARYNSSRGKS